MKLFCLNNLASCSGRSIVGAAHLVASNQPSCQFSSIGLENVKPRLTDYKRGKGGRSSFSGIVTTVFGCSGFMGKYIVNRLGKLGSQVICPYRADPHDVRELKLMGDLGQILFLPIHLEDEESLRKAMQHSNLVINLVGKDNPTSNFPFGKVNIDGCARIARIAKEVGVEKFIHFSSLNAEKDPPGHILPRGSEFLRTKYYGELEVRREFPEATVFRPSDMFGQGDRFMFYYARGYRRIHVMRTHYLPLWHGGKDTVKQPVCVSDVADGLVNAIFNPDAVGQVYDIVGPRRYRLDHLLRYFFDVLRYDKDMVFTEYKTFLPYQLKLKMIEKLRPTYPPVCLDRLEREFVTDTVTGNPTLTDLGVNLTLLENRVFWELKPYRRFNYYWDSIGEFSEPDPPPQAA